MALKHHLLMQTMCKYRHSRSGWRLRGETATSTVWNLSRVPRNVKRRNNGDRRKGGAGMLPYFHLYEPGGNHGTPARSADGKERENWFFLLCETSFFIFSCVLKKINELSLLLSFACWEHLGKKMFVAGKVSAAEGQTGRFQSSDYCCCCSQTNI